MANQVNPLSWHPPAGAHLLIAQILSIFIDHELHITQRGTVGRGHNRWLHWFDCPVPDCGRPNTDIWPESEYNPSELFEAPGLRTQGGEKCYLFSSRNQKAVDTGHSLRKGEISKNFVTGKTLPLSELSNHVTFQVYITAHWHGQTVYLSHLHEPPWGEYEGTVPQR